MGEKKEAKKPKKKEAKKPKKAKKKAKKTAVGSISKQMLLGEDAQYTKFDLQKNCERVQQDVGQWQRKNIPPTASYPEMGESACERMWIVERVIECREHFNGNFVLVSETGQRRVEGQCHRPGEPCAMYNRTLWEDYREKVCTGKAKVNRDKNERKSKQNLKAKEKSSKT